MYGIKILNMIFVQHFIRNIWLVRLKLQSHKSFTLKFRINSTRWGTYSFENHCMLEKSCIYRRFYMDHFWCLAKVAKSWSFWCKMTRNPYRTLNGAALRNEIPFQIRTNSQNIKSIAFKHFMDSFPIFSILCDYSICYIS